MSTVARIGFFGCLLAAFCLSVVPQESAQDATSAADRLLNGPDRRDIPWKVKVWEPVLTYQQRYLARIEGTIEGSYLREKAGHNLVFEVKLGDSEGHWLRGEDITEFRIPKDPPHPIGQAYFLTGVYALPGEYRVAIIIYDRAQGAATVQHVRLHVPPVKGDTLPDLTRGLPPIEFPSRIPFMNWGQGDLRAEREPGWSLARGVEHLPISTVHPLRIDVVLDFSEPDGINLPDYKHAKLTGMFSQSAYFHYLKDMLSMGSILSHLQPSHGCVRVSAIDMSRVHILLDRQDAAALDWKKLEKDLYSVDLDRIDVATMAKQHDRSAAVSRYLAQIANDPAACSAGAQPADRVVVLVSQHQEYPPHTPITPIQPEECQNCRFVYLRLTPYEFESVDPYRDILKPLHPRSFRFYTPGDFRKVLQDLTVELSVAPNN